MRFPALIFIYSVTLFADGFIFGFLSGWQDIRVLTPVFFGGIIFLMAFVTIKIDFKIFGQHAATGLGLLAFITNVGSFLDLSVTNPEHYAALSKSVAALLSLIFLILAVKKIGDERSERESKNGTE